MSLDTAQNILAVTDDTDENEYDLMENQNKTGVTTKNALIIKWMRNQEI